jgi:hypothetical protein
MHKYTVETGNAVWSIEANTPRAAALIAFATDPPEAPGMLTEVRPYEAEPGGDESVYMDSMKLLQDCGYEIHETK